MMRSKSFSFSGTVISTFEENLQGAKIAQSVILCQRLSDTFLVLHEVELPTLW